MKHSGLLLGIVLGCVTLAAQADDPLIERGRYLSKIAGCNDCHTAGYMQKNGDVPEQAWLLGDNIGWRGPWGTTYAINLRLYLQPMSEAQWLAVARNKPARPPMPWYVLREMEDDDLRALYRFIRHLGPAGTSAPGFVPPDQEPTTAYISFVPQTPGASPAAGQPAQKKESSFWDLDFKPAQPRTERP
jgi:mono/diheme cytochrome c family protein